MLLNIVRRRHSNCWTNGDFHTGPRVLLRLNERTVGAGTREAVLEEAPAERHSCLKTIRSCDGGTVADEFWRLWRLSKPAGAHVQRGGRSACCRGAERALARRVDQVLAASNSPIADDLMEVSRITQGRMLRCELVDLTGWSKPGAEDARGMPQNAGHTLSVERLREVIIDATRPG
jgi:hypothetical protein